MEANYHDVFEDWEAAIARKLCAEFLARYPWITGMGADDLVQECLLHWYLARVGYQAGKGASRKTYMGKVLRHLLNDILDQQLADRRKADHLSSSLEQTVEEEVEDVLGLAADVQERALYVDLPRALADLTPLQRRICRLLGLGYTVVEIAGILRKPRSAVYRELGQVKEVFFKHGLGDYLS